MRRNLATTQVAFEEETRVCKTAPPQKKKTLLACSVSWTRLRLQNEALPESCVAPPSCAFTLKRWWNGVFRRSGPLRKALAAVLCAAWSLHCPTANKHMRFRHPAVSKDPLNSGNCLVLFSALLFSLLSLLHTNHLSFFISPFSSSTHSPFADSFHSLKLQYALK